MTISEPQALRKALISAGRRPLSEPYSQCFQNYYHAYQCLQPTPQYISGVRSSVNHWQLRDLVQIDPYLGTLYHTHDDYIRELSQLSRRQGLPQSADYARFPYFPRCFGHAEGGVVVTGSVITSSSRAFSMALGTLFGDHALLRRPQKGLFSVFTPEMTEPLTYKVGEMINNAVALYRRPGGGYSLFVCNNDANLYTVDISTRGVHADRQVVCEANSSLNNARLLPDGKLLAVTGDSSLLFMVDALLPQPVVQRVKTGHGSGFGLLFHSNEVTVAAACEDGLCLLYDMRNMCAPFHEVKLTRAGHQSGAFRCCKFLNSPVHDLLVVLEHAGRVHLVDLRHLDSDHQQVIVFPFALNQYANYADPPKLQVPTDPTDRSLESGSAELKRSHGTLLRRTTTHRRMDVYPPDRPFTAPLVYDYSYLSQTNPKLFKDFEYEPPLLSLSEKRSGALRWNSVPECDNLPAEAPGGPLSLDAAAAYASHLNSPPMLLPPRHVFDSYQQSVNHTHGEMELSGLDWYEDQLYIGCDDGGILCWDINVRARRSFGGYSVV